MAKPPERPARERPKSMTRKEEVADAAAAEAERQGSVAFHHGKARDDCPFGEEDDPRRRRWLAGHDKASAGRKNRLDMSPTAAAGFRAFRDGLHRDECPADIKRDGKKWSEWLQGWERGERARERDEDRHR